MIHVGDNRDILPTIPDASIDAIVTDPPYELGFMGKKWDSTGIAYNVEMWRECLRVLKPGGHLLAFGGSRTYHRLASAIEDAGFEIRDQIMWVYGSGFPKSLDVSKAIDKQAGAEREVLGKHPNPGGTAPRQSMGDGWQQSPDLTAPATEAAKQWNGWGTALKPAHEPIVLARKPLNGTVADNVLTHGTGGINIDGCRVAGAKGDGCWSGKTKQKGYEGGWDSEAKPNTEPNEQGRWPANFIHDGSDEVTELFPEAQGMKRGRLRRGAPTGSSIGDGNIYDTAKPYETMSGYDDGGSAARFFYCAKANKRDRNEGLDDLTDRRQDEEDYERAGTTNPRNRSQKLRKNFHPTVKPTDLMRYLCRLITPPGGLILDPFTGSGSTGKAAILEGFRFIGIEQNPEYAHIAETRIHSATQQQ